MQINIFGDLENDQQIYNYWHNSAIYHDTPPSRPSTRGFLDVEQGITAFRNCDVQKGIALMLAVRLKIVFTIAVNPLLYFGALVHMSRALICRKISLKTAAEGFVIITINLIVQVAYLALSLLFAEFLLQKKALKCGIIQMAHLSIPYHSVFSKRPDEEQFESHFWKQLHRTRQNLIDGGQTINPNQQTATLLINRSLLTSMEELRFRDDNAIGVMDANNNFEVIIRLACCTDTSLPKCRFRLMREALRGHQGLNDPQKMAIRNALQNVQNLDLNNFSPAESTQVTQVFDKLKIIKTCVMNDCFSYLDNPENKKKSERFFVLV